MNNVENPFEKYYVSPDQEKKAVERQDYSENPFKEYEQKDTAIKNFLRWAYMIPSGVAQAVTYPMDFIQLLGMGAILDPEELDQIRKISEREGIPFDEEEYMKKYQEAMNLFPTQSNIERMIEEETGAPLTPKTTGQKLLRLGANAGKFTPGTLTQKIGGGAAAAGTTAGLEALGVPEPLAEFIGLPAGVGIGAKLPKTSPRLTVATKPSGLPKRQFEKITEPRKVSEKKISQVSEKLEGDFKKVADDIISKSEVAETKSKLIDDPAYKSEVAEGFKKVEELAEQFPETIHTQTVGKNLIERGNKRVGTGYTPSEYDKDYIKFINQIFKETPSQEMSVAKHVGQYRKNNKALSEAYDPSRSYAYNRAKKDAILDYNRAIAETFEKELPNSEFTKLFKDQNKKWREIMDVEAMDKFFDAMFEDKIQFSKGKRFFQNENIARPFKRALGEKGFKEFEQLMKDFLSSEKSFKMLQKAKDKGFRDLFETAGAFILHPKLGKAKLAYQGMKRGYNTFINSILDKPQLKFEWQEAVDSLKAGDFAKAEKQFSDLKVKTEQYRNDVIYLPYK